MVRELDNAYSLICHIFIGYLLCASNCRNNSPGIIAHEDRDFLLFTVVPSRIVAGTGEMLDYSGFSREIEPI